jgi:hypothetical protein
MSEFYIFLAQIPDAYHREKKWRNDFSKELERKLRECFDSATLEKIETPEKFLNLPKNEKYSEVYAISLPKITQELKDRIRDSFSNCKHKFIPYDEIAKKF